MQTREVLTDIVFCVSGAVYKDRLVDGKLREGGRGLQAEAQRPAGQRRPQVSTDTSTTLNNLSRTVIVLINIVT